MMLSKKNSEALENFSEKLEVEGRSLWQDARRRFMHNRAAVTSLIMLVLIALFVTFAPMVSSFSYFDTDWGMMSNAPDMALSLIHISEPTRLGMISYAVFCLKKKNIRAHETDTYHEYSLLLVKDTETTA